jgi:hypothetical protein
VEHDNSGSFPAWHCAEVMLTDKHTGEELRAHVHKWISDADVTGGMSALCREVPVEKFGQSPLPGM